MSRIFLTVLLLLGSACVDKRNPDVNDRGQYWTDAIETYLADERTVAEMSEWLELRGAESLARSGHANPPTESAGNMSDPEANDYFARLEEFELDGVVCTSWGFALRVRADVDDRIVSHDILSEGRCL